jgi:hypothetical protein
MTQCHETPEYFFIGCNSRFIQFIQLAYWLTHRAVVEAYDVVASRQDALVSLASFQSAQGSLLSKTHKCVTYHKTKGFNDTVLNTVRTHILLRAVHSTRRVSASVIV